MLGATRSMWLAAGLAGLAAGLRAVDLPSAGRARSRDRATLLAVRIALFAVVGFALLRPVLLLKVAVPQQNFVGILLDDSRSMQIADQDGKPRSEFLISQLGRPDAALLTELGKRFQVKVFRFSSAPNDWSAADLTFRAPGPASARRSTARARS